ncbi:O-antigen ligase family protein, partial [Myxococcota bacterium]|nr:O-antigen ligase family protein [Myxococcota bacterium]
MRLAPPHGAPLAVALLCLFTTPLIDRLDLQKLLIGVASVAALSLLALGRRLPPLPGLALLIPLSLGALIAPEATWARVEGWSLLVLGLGIFIFAATRPGAATRRGIARLAAILSLIAVAQALGAPFFNERLSFQGRGVVATLGNPGHLGAALAMALPFTAPDPRGRPGRGRLFGLTLAALILTGSRTAWVMAAPGLWCFWRGAGQGRARVALRAALLVAGLVALGGAALPQRAASAPGAAAGRLYLWRVHLSGLAELSPFGYGPEAFQRRWPARQRAYLAAQPQGTPRYTDLRHAHADLIELLDEVGLMGLLGLGWLAWRLERRAKAGRTARMAGAALAAGLIGGLAMPVLWTPSGLALLALAAGARWPIS